MFFFRVSCVLFLCGLTYNSFEAAPFFSGASRSLEVVWDFVTCFYERVYYKKPQDIFHKIYLVPIIP